MITGFAQHYKCCKVFQYIGADSLNKELVEESYYNSNGQLILFCGYIGYKDCMSCGRNSGSDFNEYKGSKLMLTRSFDEHTEDSIKKVFYYNIPGQKIEEEYFDYRRRQKKDSKKGLGQPGGCVVFDSDFEKDRTWQKMGEIIFQYDSNGNKITSDDLRSGIDVAGGSHKWTYDNNNRIIIDSAFAFNYGHGINSVTAYTYSQNLYQFTCTFYENDKPIYDKYPTPYTCVYKLNEQGKIIEKLYLDSGGKIDSKETTHYNFSGNIERQILFDSEGKSITHIYSYE